MNNVSSYLISVAIAILLPVSGAYAQLAPAKAAVEKLAPASKAEPLKIDLKRSKIVNAGANESSAPADVAKPGDILEEVATYTNQSKDTLRQVKATLPIPLNTELVMASVKPSNALASLDGVNFSAVPLKRKVRQANGVELETPVPLSEYRFLRWNPVDLAAQKSVVFSARFKVSDSSPIKTAANSKP